VSTPKLLHNVSLSRTTISRRRSAKVQNFEFLSGTPGCAKLLSHVRSALEAIEKKGNFKAHEGANKAYSDQRDLVKQAKAHPTKRDGITSKGTESSKKSIKKPKETAAVASQADPVLQAEYASYIKQAQEATVKAKPRESKLLWT
jgi:hypothetical protein